MVILVTCIAGQPACSVYSFQTHALVCQPECGIQVAAVDKPKVHLWETGITRITRHPQNTGQLIWCLGHLLWIGNSFMVTTSAALVAHHVFACYHGDFRLRRKHGEVSLVVLSVSAQFGISVASVSIISQKCYAAVFTKHCSVALDAAVLSSVSVCATFTSVVL